MDLLDQDLAGYKNTEILKYIDALENLNEQLITALRQCVGLLSSVKPLVPDPGAWQEVLDLIRETLKVAEKTSRERMLH